MALYSDAHSPELPCCCMHWRCCQRRATTNKGGDLSAGLTRPPPVQLLVGAVQEVQVVAVHLQAGTEGARPSELGMAQGDFWNPKPSSPSFCPAPLPFTLSPPAFRPP